MTQRAIDGDFIYFVTANVQNRRWFFVYPERAEKLGQAIQTCCGMKGFSLLAYCILPNHVHILIRKISPDTTPQRTLGSVRCGERENGSGNETNSRGVDRDLETKSTFLLSHQRLSSVEDGPDQRIGKAKKPTLSENSYLYAHRRRPRRRSTEPEKRYTLSELMHSIKSTFSHSLDRGKFWQHRSNFRIIANEKYLRNAITYITFNYQKMNLPKNFGQPPFVYVNHQAIDDAFAGTEHM